MKEFSIMAVNRPGQLAHICELLGSGVVNIKSISTERTPTATFIKLITNDDASTRSILEKNNLDFIEGEVISIKLRDRPGAMARFARKIAGANINIDCLYQIGSLVDDNNVLYQKYAIAVDPIRLDDAKKLLNGEKYEE